MAEKIDWDNFYNQVVNNQSRYRARYSGFGVDFGNLYERGVNFVTRPRPFVSKIGDAFSAVPGIANRAAKDWINNVDPRKIKDKSMAWRIGAAVGAAETIVALTVLPGSGFAKGMINFGATQAVWGATRVYYEYQRNQIHKQFQGTPYLDVQLANLDTRRTGTDRMVKDFFKGIGAAGAYSPLAGLAEQGLGAIRLPNIGNFFNNVDRISTPTPTIPSAAVTPTTEHFTPTPKVDMTATPTVEAHTPTSVPPTATETHVPTSTPTEVPVKTPTATATAPTPTAEATPPHVEPTPKVVPPKVETPPATDPHAVTKPPVEAKPAAPINPVTPPKPATPPIHQETPIATPKTPPSTGGAAAETIIHPNPLSYQEKVAKFIAENKGNPEMITDHVVAQGETAGHLVMQMDAPLTWDGTDWQGFAALWAMNPDSFRDIQSSMGLSDAQFAELVKRMANHDKGAYDQMIKHMSLLRSGSHVKLVTAAGMKKLLSL